MKCSACRAQLDAYRDGDLSPSMGATITSHLESCNECQGFLDQLGAVERGLGALHSVEPRADFTTLVMAKIATMPAPAPARARLRVWWIGIYELIAWAVVLALTATGLLHWKSVIADTSVTVGKLGIAGTDLYRLADHFHLFSYAAAGVLLELVLFGVLMTVGRRYLSGVRAVLFGAQTA